MSLWQSSEAQRVQEPISPQGSIQEPYARAQFSKSKLRLDVQQFLNGNGRLP
jgi:hypothetical protein